MGLRAAQCCIENAMGFILYAGGNAWLLVPDCMVASQAAMTKYGPLRPLFELSEDHLDPESLRRVMEDIEENMFAEISKTLALDLISRVSPRQPPRAPAV